MTFTTCASSVCVHVTLGDRSWEVATSVPQQIYTIPTSFPFIM